MTKDLEKEYSEMMKSDLPDLWERISAELPVKEVKPKKTRIYRFAIAAAACVCVAVIVPIIAMTQRAGHKADQVNYSMSAAAVDMEAKKIESSPAEAAAWAEEEEIVQSNEAVMEEAAVEEAAAEDAAETVIAAGGAGEMDAEEAAIDDAAETEAIAAAGDVQETGAEEAAAAVTAAEDAQESAAAAMPESIIPDVSVSITKVYTGENGWTFCEATVLAAKTLSGDPALQNGDRILLAADESTDEEMIKELKEGEIELNLLVAELDGETIYLIR